MQAHALALEHPHNFLKVTDVGRLSVECTHCGALKYEGETESLCCMKGNVQLESFPQGVDNNGKNFLANIRRYNSAFQMTSFGCNEVTMPGFNLSFRIQNHEYHCIGSMIPSGIWKQWTWKIEMEN